MLKYGSAFPEVYIRVPPSISVILTTYNRPELLEGAIRSILGQTFQDFEIIVVDDGSQPPVEPVSNSFHEKRIAYFFQPNRGLAAARNTGIRLAKGRYIAFLDDDDRYFPEKLAIQFEFLEVNPEYCMVLGGHQVVNQFGKEILIIKPWIHHDLNDPKTWLFGNPTVPSVPLIRKECLEQIGGFDSTNGVLDDNDLWIRLCFAGCRIGFVDSIVARYSAHSNSLSRNHVTMRSQLMRTITKFYENKILPEEYLQIKARVFAINYLTCAMLATIANDFSAARDDLRLAVRQWPGIFQNSQVFLQKVSDYAQSYLVDEPDTFIRNIFQHLPTEARPLGRLYRRTTGKSIQMGLIRQYEKENYRGVRQSFLRLFFYDPRLCFSKWTLSCLVKSILGERMTRMIVNFRRIRKVSANV